MNLALRIGARAIHIISLLSLIASLAIGPVAFAVQVQMRQALELKTLGDGQAAVGLLAAGTIVDVPDQYRVNDPDGRFNSELTLNNWLQNAGKTGAYQADRAGGIFLQAPTSLDYFYPVKIVSLAPGSNIPSTNGKTYFLALRWLKRTPQKQLVTMQDTPVSAGVPATASASRLEAQCPNGQCLNRARSISPAFDRLVRELGPALARAQVRERRNRARTAGDMQHISEVFQRSCGFSLESFVPVVRARANAAGIPPSILLSMMVQESGGRCFATGTNDHDFTSDHGLFGINSRGSNYRSCSYAEISTIRRMRAADLTAGPRCIENPVLNLDASIRILKSKLDDLDLRGGFNDRRLRDANGHPTADAWRLAVSAYNGGERWVIRAREDLEAFNRRQGTTLDPHNWEDLRIFYLRSFLDEDREGRYFGNYRQGRTDTALLNLAYAENVVPRRQALPGESAPVASLWRDWQ